ncbi:MAG: peptidoglycan editing factor PgeF [Pseudomonadota bacterium]
MNVIYSQHLQSVDAVIHGFGVGSIDLETHLKTRDIQNYTSFNTDQLHGRRVHVLTDKQDEGILYGDVFITDRPNVICHVRTADCVPILIADRHRKAVAAVHAGWRGTGLDVVGETIRQMKVSFGTDPGDCIAAIGPRICGKCYEVGAEVIQALEELNIDDEWKAAKRSVDLGVANKLLLMKAGVPRKNIDMLAHCTCCNERFISWRRDCDKNKRQVNFILLNEYCATHQQL